MKWPFSKTLSCSPIFRRPNFQPKINCRIEFKFCNSYSGSSSCALYSVFAVFAQKSIYLPSSVGKKMAATGRVTPSKLQTMHQRAKKSTLAFFSLLFRGI